MEFLKGTIVGIIAGTCLGVIKNDMFTDAMKMGRKEFRKMKRKFNF